MAKSKWCLSPLKERITVVRSIIVDKKLLRSYSKGHGLPPGVMQMEMDHYLFHGEVCRHDFAPVLRVQADRYLFYGEDGLKVIRRTYSKQERFFIIKRMKDNKLTLYDVSVLYMVSAQFVKYWLEMYDGSYDLRKYCEYSNRVERHMTEEKGPSKRKPSKRKATKEQAELKRLRAEVSFLRTENAYLKKLQALAQEDLHRKDGK
jgi:transposase